jgi:hypothetical protein
MANNKGSIAVSFRPDELDRLQLAAQAKGQTVPQYLADLLYRSIVDLKAEAIEAPGREPNKAVSFTVDSPTFMAFDACRQLLGQTRSSLIRKLVEESYQ